MQPFLQSNPYNVKVPKWLSRHTVRIRRPPLKTAFFLSSFLAIFKLYNFIFRPPSTLHLFMSLAVSLFTTTYTTLFTLSVQSCPFLAPKSSEFFPILRLYVKAFLSPTAGE